MAVRSIELEVDGIRTRCLSVEGGGTPTVFVHGNPTHSFDWLPFLERHRGPALAYDMPCFGRTERLPPERFDCSLEAYAGFFEAFLEANAIDDYSLVVHDWGGSALAGALARPQRVRRLVVIDAVPLLAGYRWHWLARLWRRRPAGEILMAMTTKSAVRLLLRLARPRLRPMPSNFVDELWECFDRDTRRAVLALYRSADPERLAEAGRRLGELSCPALVIWGDSDPYIGSEMAHAYGEAIPGSELEIVAGAGHWPWIDRPQVIDRVLEFLGGAEL